jgi:hypothetical protein
MEFDLIVANLPFLIAPTARYLYRDSGMRGDEFVRRIVRDSPPLLTEGGFFQLLYQWPVTRQEDSRAHLKRAFQNLGYDALVLKVEELDVGRYAQGWIRDTETDDPKEAAGAFAAWMKFYEDEGIQSVGSGLVALRKRSGPKNWIHLDDAPENLNQPTGDAVLRRFSVLDYLETIDDPRLLEARLTAAPGVRLTQIAVPSNDKWKIASARLRLESGMQYEGNIDAFVGNFIPRCDGRQTVGSIVSDLAPMTGASPDKIAPPFLMVLRTLIARGFVSPELSP